MLEYLNISLIGQLSLAQRQRSHTILRPSTLMSSTMATLLRQRQRLQGTSNVSDLRQQILRLIAARRSGSGASSASLTSTRNRSRVVPQCPEISCVPVSANCRRMTFYMTTAGRRCRGCDFNRCEDFESRWGKGFSRIPVE